MRFQFPKVESKVSGGYIIGAIINDKVSEENYFSNVDFADCEIFVSENDSFDSCKFEHCTINAKDVSNFGSNTTFYECEFVGLDQDEAEMKEYATFNNCFHDCGTPLFEEE